MGATPTQVPALRRDLWRLVRHLRPADAAMLRELARFDPPARVESCRDHSPERVLIWFDRSDARIPATATAIPWILERRMLVWPEVQP